jgi:CheY-like chemotaxis protein
MENDTQTAKELNPQDASILNKKVLIVDDDKFLLEMYARKFQKVGFKISTALSGVDAIEQIKNGDNPDIFVFDLIMPKMDGIELIETVKKENLIPNAVKIVLSNQGQQSDIDRVNGVGVDGYIIKALHTPSEVVQLVLDIYKKNKS